MIRDNISQLPNGGIEDMQPASNINSFESAQLFSLDFTKLPSIYFAEQLTFIDKTLFKNVHAHHCLSGVWSNRYQKVPKSQLISQNSPVESSNTTNNTNKGNHQIANNDKTAAIKATIDQYNRLTSYVQVTILENSTLSISKRAKVIEKWIEIAQECRRYKNFSALNSITLALSSGCLERLKKTWAEVSS
jgi:hypothetical protein